MLNISGRRARGEMKDGLEDMWQESRSMESALGSEPRLAASSYLNTAPLIWSFIHGSRRGQVQLLTDTAPARCALMLARDEVLAALVPVIEYQRMDEVLAVPGVCVGSRERVRSVVLVTRGLELKDVRRVALSRESRTSVALVQIIFREFLGLEPELKSYAPDLSMMLRENDAALIIGDPAMVFPREGLRVYDMASLWREQTGLGFVFAMWMAREASARRVQAVDFAGARDEGLEHVDEIAALYEGELGLPRGELREYLLENISFTLDEEMRAGLDLFYRLAHKHGIIPALRPLKMLE
ncbi:MAG TPA: menaquinone biosynthesis protein [Pyrinomonadaceae bacterium]|nr:menaquinone biosynthesis protein [Pyrinomonadaceae bacterium]